MKFQRAVEGIALVAYLGYQCYRVWEQYAWWVLPVMLVANLVGFYIAYRLLIRWYVRRG